MAFYLAIDNGGTKADYVLADDTRELGRVRSGTIKRMRVDEQTAQQNLETALAQLTKATGVSMQSISHTCIGTAGETVPLVADWLKQAISTRVSGDLLLLGDMEIALDAAFSGSHGILVLAGTGSNIAGRGLAGMIGAGGWGPVLADQGSGHSIGLSALRSIFLAIDEGRSTTMLPAVLAFWNLQTRNDLVVHANQSPAPDVSQLIQLVLRCAEEGDEVAAGVLRKEGEDLGYLVRLVLRRLYASGTYTEPLAVAFAGSIMEKVLPVRQALIADVRKEFSSLRILDGVVDPVAGALWRARIAGRG